MTQILAIQLIRGHPQQSTWKQPPSTKSPLTSAVPNAGLCSPTYLEVMGTQANYCLTCVWEPAKSQGSMNIDSAMPQCHINVIGEVCHCGHVFP